MTKFVVQLTLLALSVIVITTVGLSYAGVDFGFLTEIFDFLFMITASFDWIVPFTTVKVVVLSMVSMEMILLVIRVFTYLGNTTKT
jgi:hypothetical protein